MGANRRQRLVHFNNPDQLRRLDKQHNRRRQHAPDMSENHRLGVFSSNSSKLWAAISDKPVTPVQHAFLLKKKIRCRVWVHVCPCISVNTAASFQCLSPNHCGSNLLAQTCWERRFYSSSCVYFTPRLQRRLTRLKLKYESNQNQSGFSLSREE